LHRAISSREGSPPDPRLQYLLLACRTSAAMAQGETGIFDAQPENRSINKPQGDI